MGACDEDDACGGVTREPSGGYTLRRAGALARSTSGEVTFVKSAGDEPEALGALSAVAAAWNDAASDEAASSAAAAEVQVSGLASAAAEVSLWPRTAEEAHQMVPTLDALASLSEMRGASGEAVEGEVNRRAEGSNNENNKNNKNNPATKEHEDEGDLHGRAASPPLRAVAGLVLAQAATAFAHCEGQPGGAFASAPWSTLQRAALQCAAFDQAAAAASGGGVRVGEGCSRALRHWTALNLALQLQRPCLAGWPAAALSSGLGGHGTEDSKQAEQEEQEEQGGQLGLPLHQAAWARRLFRGAAAAQPGDAVAWQRLATFEAHDGRPSACVRVLATGAAAVAAAASAARAEAVSGGVAEGEEDEGANAGTAAAAQLYHALGAHLHDRRAWAPALAAFKSALQVGDSNAPCLRF